MAKSKSNDIKIVVLPATDNARKEGYARANGKIIPFEATVVVPIDVYEALKRIKEPVVEDAGTIDVKDMMDTLRVSQEKMNAIAKMSPEMMRKRKVKFINKYYVKAI